ncbi:monofunctional biosynthetic peptidoglycan transglycosylase [Lysobacteraceae bacterium NML93-0792]|nr:monofunctional biosynthetic peptidoglycan transglycosylase [Xanthomonadaceae bacterium NML93-0792]PBS16735.1 monofunctional biosynthetic peptidoglycan transglycosylase [Xanthomonadaceae bacterium NML93-0793]PBS19332.1 monofunctional biosynthetic peptidoglycan transglycosylase [Xanthomonadaceae bacterium NML93-0831]
MTQRDDHDGGANARVQAPTRRGRRWLRRLLWLPVFVVGLTVLQVLALRVIDPPGSAFMAIRQVQAWAGGEDDFTLYYQWRDLDRIAPSLAVSVIAAEDQNFARHRGFDLDAIEQARAHNARGGSTRGASTISQQTAKNLFLWGGRSWVRKGLEVWYTVLIELLWPKSRILEVYVNVAEFGDGIYGAQAAAQRHFGKDAAQLTPSESARLAAVLPSPRRYSASRPGPYVQRRAQWIQRNARQIGGDAYLEALK